MNQIQIVLVLVTVLSVTQVLSQCGPPTVFKRLDECCTYGKLISDSVMDTCRGQHAALPKTPRQPGEPLRGSCRTECAFNQTGLYANGALNEEKIRTAFVAGAGAAFASIATAALDTCLPLAKSRAAEFTATVTSGANKCSPITLVFIMCVHSNMMLSCPAANFQSSDADCVTLQTHFRNCPNGL